MIGKLFGVICIISLIFGTFCGNIENMGMAVLDGASSAVNLTISLLGIMCLWNGILEVLREYGAISFVTKLISPVLRLFFPDTFKRGRKGGCEELTAAISANLLGIGNAATPLAISALKKMKENHIKDGGSPDTASADMITLSVLNTASANLMPTAIVALLRGGGAQNPLRVVLPIQITSSVCALFALIIARAFGAIDKERRQK